METQTHEVETASAAGSAANAAADTSNSGTANSYENEDDPGTTTVTETVLIRTLYHKTTEEMREEYRFNTHQNEYLSLLSAEDAAPLWGELSDCALQWPLPVVGMTTSP